MARAQMTTLLEQAASLWEERQFDDVLRISEEILAADPRSAPARHFRAAALLEQGRRDEALAEFERAQKLDAHDPEILLGLTDLLVCHSGEDLEQIGRGLLLCEKGRKLARREEDPELEFEFLVLEGTGLNHVGESARALGALDAALQILPGSLGAQLERAIALFELCRFDEAKKAFEQIVREAPDAPRAHHHLGLIAERRGEEKEAARCFQRAQELLPEEFPPPVRLDDAEFDKAVEVAIAQLPEDVREYLENTTIAVEPIPADEDLVSSDPPLSPSILGVFRGTPVGERSIDNAWDHAPASIILYQRNLERFARTREELIEQIEITVMHEFGHLIGLDEHDLWERGLD
ncbi:MAG: metallopeptidase family protein [Myxococcaceae bacterium]